MTVINALIWKEKRNCQKDLIFALFIGVIMIISFMQLMWWGPLPVLYLQLLIGYLPLRRSFLDEIRSKSLESLLSSPCDETTLWSEKFFLYSVIAVISSFILTVLTYWITGNHLFASLDLFAVSPLTIIIFSLAGILFWRVSQPFADISAVFVIAVIPLLILYLPFPCGLLLAIGIIICSYLLSSDKEAIVNR